MADVPRKTTNADLRAFLLKYPEWKNAPAVGVMLLMRAEEHEPEKFREWSKTEAPDAGWHLRSPFRLI